MAYDFQITVDCSRPHELAEWWAEVLGWGVEPTDEAFIRRMVEEGKARESDTMEWRGVLVWRIGAAINGPGDPARRMLFQEVPERKTVKNRTHLDVRVGTDKLEKDRPGWSQRVQPSFIEVPKGRSDGSRSPIRRATSSVSPDRTSTGHLMEWTFCRRRTVPGRWGRLTSVRRNRWE